MNKESSANDPAEPKPHSASQPERKPSSSAPKGRAIDLEKITFWQIVWSLKWAHVWRTLTALAVIIGSVTSFAFWAGGWYLREKIEIIRERITNIREQNKNLESKNKDLQHKIEILSSLPELSVAEEEDQRKVIRLFYLGISAGAEGDSKGWEKAFNQWSKPFQNKFREWWGPVYPGSTSTGLMQKTYGDSGTHDLLSIRRSEIRGEGASQHYTVVYTETKPIVPNPLFLQFVSGSRASGGKYFEKTPDEVYEEILTAIGSRYQFSSEKPELKKASEKDVREEIRKHLKGLSIRALMGGNLVWETAVSFALNELPPSPLRYQKEKYNIRYTVSLTLVKEGESWKISAFSRHSSSYSKVPD